MSDNREPNAPDLEDDKPPDVSRSYIGPTAIPVTHNPAIETKSVVIAAHVDPRRAPTQRRLERPPLNPPPNFVEQPPPAEPVSVRTVGGHTERLVTVGSSPPPPVALADSARIHADFSADGDHARTVGGRTERLAHVPADVVAAGGVGDTAVLPAIQAHPVGGDTAVLPAVPARTVGGRTERMQTVPADVAAAANAEHAPDSSPWGTDPPAPGAVNRTALPSNYASTMSGAPKSDRSLEPIASSKPPRNNNNLIIGVLALLVIGAGAFLALRGSDDGAASGSAPPMSVPAPKQTSVAQTAAPAPDPLASPTVDDTAPSALPSSAPAALTGRVFPPTRPTATPTAAPAKTAAPAAPTGPTLPPQIF